MDGITQADAPASGPVIPATEGRNRFTQGVSGVDYAASTRGAYSAGSSTKNREPVHRQKGRTKPSTDSTMPGGKRAVR